MSFNILHELGEDSPSWRLIFLFPGIVMDLGEDMHKR